MAFGFGVGDIIVLTNLLVTTIEDIHDAPKELQELADRVESIEATLESIDELPYNAAVQNMRNMMRLKERVKQDLAQDARHCNQIPEQQRPGQSFQPSHVRCLGQA